MRNIATQDNSELEALEQREWRESLDYVIQQGDLERVHRLLSSLRNHARAAGVSLPFSAVTPYLNTMRAADQTPMPGSQEIERRVKSPVRWNAMAMVVRGNRASDGIGGHISTYASAATLYEVGFNHFFRGKSTDGGGDVIYFQGHASPGIYARAYLEGRLPVEKLHNFRRELAPGGGLSSYPHPWLMPDFWEYPTVSMGLGPIMSIYQARFNRYLEDRGLKKTTGSKVWAFLGDGETDEPESLGAIGLASREKLDNLIFVINCNLQRLDGPVRGNGKIIQELESEFRGSGWNVIKLIWGSYWDPLLARDKDGRLRKVMMATVDGDYRAMKANDGAFVRKHFFGQDPKLLESVANMSDEDIWRLQRGGHDPQKVYAAFHRAAHHEGQPTVLLVKTVKGFGMGKSGEGKNTAHQTNKLVDEDVLAFRDRWNIPNPDDKLGDIPFYKPADDTPEMKYLQERRQALGGYLPHRRTKADEQLAVPPLDTFKAVLEPTTEGRAISTTQAFVRFLTQMLRDRELGPRAVPILVDEARTFGMEGLFRQIGIYNPAGQNYTPVDRDQVMYYREDKTGQVLQEGINEPGGMSSWIAAATSYSTNNRIMVPFYVYYSMFGFQRVGDLAWAAGDMQARGFLLGGTSGRTTLNGEGLQHEDGHSHILAGTIPNCISYDPTFAYEVVAIVRDGMRRMYTDQEDVYYYITLMNENYPHPGMPEGSEAGILKGLYQLSDGGKTPKKGHRVQLMGSGTILREVMAAAELVKNDFDIAADVWSATSYNELRRDGMAAERWNRLHPTDEARKGHVEACLAGHDGP